MKRVFIGLLGLMLCLSSTIAQKNFLDVNYIEVTGTAEMEIDPDMIYLRITINEKDFKKNTSIDDQEKSMIEALTKLGIDTKKDLSMEDLDSSFKKKRFSLSDILLSKRYILLVHDGPTASNVYSELEEIGISNISISKIDHSKIVDFRKKVRENAVIAAKEKAEYLTKAVGQSIGKALYIEERDVFTEPVYRTSNAKMFSYGGSSDDNYQSEVNFKTINIKFSMLVRFELK